MLSAREDLDESAQEKREGKKRSEENYSSLAPLKTHIMKVLRV